MVARVTATLLAVWQGRWAEAEAHLARAEELSGDRTRLLFYGLDAVRAELALASGDTGRAVAAAMAGAERGGHANLVERLDPAGREGARGRGAGTPGSRRGPRASRDASGQSADPLSTSRRRSRARPDAPGSGPRDAGVV